MLIVSLQDLGYPEYRAASWSHLVYESWAWFITKPFSSHVIYVVFAVEFIQGHPTSIFGNHF